MNHEVDDEMVRVYLWEEDIGVEILERESVSPVGAVQVEFNFDLHQRVGGRLGQACHGRGEAAGKVSSALAPTSVGPRQYLQVDSQRVFSTILYVYYRSDVASSRPVVGVGS